MILGLDLEIDLPGKNSWLEKFILEVTESIPPLSRPFTYRAASRDDGCACLLMDDEGFEMDGARSADFNSARQDLARLLRECTNRGSVEILAYWLGEEPSPAVTPNTISVDQLISTPASFRTSGTPYYYVVNA
jgi:hypothetical protein